MIDLIPAEEQAKIQKVMDALKQEVDKRDAEIKNLQRSLKEAETILVSSAGRTAYRYVCN